MAIHNLNFGGAAFRPAKANAPLLIHANAVLSFAIAFESLESVAWWDAQIFEFRRCVNHHQLAVHNTLKILRQTTGDKTLVKFLRFNVAETLNHPGLITQNVINGKR